MTGPRPGLVAAGLVVVGTLAAFLASGLLTGDWWALGAWGAYPLVGLVILRSRPGNAIGRLMVAIGACWALNAGTLLGDAVSVWLELIFTAAQYQGFTLVFLLLLLYPTGRAGSVLGHIVTWMVLLLATLLLVATALWLPLASGRTNPLQLPTTPAAVDWLLGEQGFVIVLIIISGILVELWLRWRAGTEQERLQLRWLAWAVGVVVAVIGLSTLAPQFPLPSFIFVAFNLVPVAIGVAILRYRLYEIDRIVSRTVSYAAVTGVVLGVYGLVVTSVTRLLPSSGALPVAGATLVAAAVFRPLLRRVRGWVDRRFDRARFDGARAAEAFAGRLASAVDPDEVAADLAGTVRATLAPRSVGVWLAGAR